FAARIPFSRGLERAAVCLLHRIPIRGSVLFGELRPADAQLEQPRGRFVVRTRGRELFRFRDGLSDFGRFGRLGRSARVGSKRRGIDRWRRFGRGGFRGGWLPATGNQQAKAQQRGNEQRLIQ